MPNFLAAAVVQGLSPKFSSFFFFLFGQTPLQHQIFSLQQWTTVVFLFGFLATANWILMDYGDIVVHIFDEENRVFYDLERIWRDGKTVSKESLS